MRESCRVGLSWALRGDEGGRELRDFGSLQRHCPPAAEVRPTPFHYPSGDPEPRWERDWMPTPSLPPKLPPTQTQTPSEERRAKHPSVPESRNRGGERSGCSPNASAEGILVPWNQSCRAFSRRLRAGRRTQAGGRGWKRAPGACRGPWPRGEQVVRRPRSRPLGSNFPAAWRGGQRGEGEGSGEGKGGARLLVPCAERRCAAPRALLSVGSAPTGRLLVWWPPPRLAAGAKAHQRRIGRSGIPSGCPLAAGHLPAATSGALGAPQRSRGSAPPLSMPGAWTPRPAPPGSVPGRRRTRLLAEHGACSPDPILSSCSRRSSARSTFPRFLRPARPPPPRPRLLQLPPSPPASPSPRPPVAPCRPPP